MTEVKIIKLRFFYNKSSRQHYVLLGENLYVVNEKTARMISEKEQLDIVDGEDLKAIQIMSKG